MIDNIHDYCKLGIVHSMAFPQSNLNETVYLDTLKHLLNDSYFDLIEIGEMPFKSLNEKVSKLIHSSHCQLTYSGHSRLFKNKLNINSCDEEERLAAVRELKKGIDEAYEWNALNFQFLSRQWNQSTLNENFNSLVKSTLELCKYAKEKGNMNICHENFDSNIDKCSLIGPTSLALKYVKEVTKKYDNFGFLVDCSHFPMIGETIDESIDPISKYIIHSHMGNTLIKDSSDPCYGDNHPPFGYPGSENDTEYLSQYLRKLLDIGYLNKRNRPGLSFEVKPRTNEDSLLVIANAKRTLRDAWRMI